MMKYIIYNFLFFIFCNKIFAQSVSSDALCNSNDLYLQSWQMSGYGILGGCIDWESNIEFRKNRIAENYNSPGSEGHGSFKHWKNEKQATTKMGCDSGNCINGIGRYIDSNYNVYVGQFKDGKKNGFGRMIYHTKYTDYIYEGNWKMDNRHGFGKIGELKNKETSIFYFYVGNWKYNFWEGQGTLINVHGHGDDVYLYTGSFCSGFAKGKGTLVFLKTTHFNNESFDKELESFWQLQEKRSTMKLEDIPETIIIKRYEGNFINVEPELPVKNLNYAALDGYGKFCEYSNDYTEKVFFDGTFVKGKFKSGTQIRQFLNTNDWTKTEGEWEISSNFHGLLFGREIMKNGQKYEGYFQNQRYNGPGKFTYSKILNGKRENDIADVEIGLFKDGQFSRSLTSTESIDLFKRIEELDKKMKNNVLSYSTENLVVEQNNKTTGKCISGDCNNGLGTWVNGNGDIFWGEWKDGKQNGFGGFEQKIDGTKWEGQWKNNMWDGYGVYTYPDGKIQLGFWVAGKFDKSKKLDNFSNPFNQFDDQGKPHGLWIIFFEESNSPYNLYVDNPYNIKNIGHYKNGVLDGRWLYYTNGQILREENYKLGVKHGKFITYWGDGFAQYRRLRKIENYVNGELDGLYKEYTHFGNNVLLECNYNKGIKNGEEIEYYNIEYGYSDRSHLVAPIKVKRQYKFGKIDGDVLFYREDGILIRKDRYKMGVVEFSYTF